jgi:hypothetical protein
MSNIQIVHAEEYDFHFLETVGIPEETVRATGLLIRKSAAKNEPMKPALLEIAREITREYPVYLCANYAAAALILAGAAKPERAFEPLYRAWLIGEKAINGHGVRQLRASTTQANSSFLQAGAQLAKLYVFRSKLDAGLTLAELVGRLDVEKATNARFVEAHIHQLMGMATAVESLRSIALEGNPMAFYALGLEQLRRSKYDEAQDSFWQGIQQAPEVAEILLNAPLTTRKTRLQEREATSYVETFCLSEWTAADLSVLNKVVGKVDSSIRTFAP